jgi:hypothetical protein
MDDATAGRIAKAADGHGLVVFGAIAGYDTLERLERALAGNGDTTGYDDELAVLLVERAPDDAAVTAIAANDARSAVQHAAAERLGPASGPWVAARAHIDAQLAELADDTTVSHRGTAAHRCVERLERDAPIGVAAEVLRDLFAGKGPLGALAGDDLSGRIDLVSRAVRDLERRPASQRILDRLCDEHDRLDPLTAIALTATLVARRAAHRKRVDGLSTPALAAALVALEALGNTDICIDSGITSAHNVAEPLAGVHLERCGTVFGPGGTAELLGWVDADRSDEHGALQQLQAQNSIVHRLVRHARTAGRRDLIVETIEHVTAGGTSTFAIGALQPDDITASCNPAAYARALPNHSTYVHAIATAEHLDRVQILETLIEHRPDLAVELLAALPHGSEADYPRLSLAWKRASMVQCGLARWLHLNAGARDELVAAAAGIGIERWEAIALLCEEFRGTPHELIAVVDAVAGAAAATPEAAQA